ncbi:MAG: hydrogenase nickel incorporation protein HypA [Candidatus Methanoplasma sp.]|jgi:hypothetical protein|nr:hydrogenase nickel incorporation protein HypA [Candidatus Methanoplasma sp.]
MTHDHDHHDHNHDHGDDCHCQACEDEKNGKTSIEEAGGVAIGLTGHIHGFNADAEARLANALLDTGKWVEKESGALLGHIKAAIYLEDGKGVTLNLTDLENGVEHHGTLAPQEKVTFNFMSAVLDVDGHELEHVMVDALDDNGLNYHLDNHHHHHDHGDECCDHDHDGHHDHNHHGHGHEDECCDHDHDDHEHGHHGHDHHHGHEHAHSHAHDEEEEGECHCKACEDRRAEGSEKSDKKSFWDRLRRK